MRTRAILCLLLAAAMLLPGCTKKAQTAGRSPGEMSAIRVVHASVNAPTLNVYISDLKVASDMMTGAASEYAPFAAGSYEVRAYDVTSPDKPVLASKISLSGGDNYTLLIIGPPATLSTMLLTDTASLPGEGKSMVRVVNVSPGAPEFDVLAANGDITIAKALGFGKTSKYREIKPDTYEIKVHPAGLPTTVLTLPDTEFKSGKAYTIVVTGVLDANTLTAPVFEDK